MVCCGKVRVDWNSHVVGCRFGMEWWNEQRKLPSLQVGQVDQAALQGLQSPKTKTLDIHKSANKGADLSLNYH